LRWHTPVVPALGRWKQEDFKFKFEANLGYTETICLKNQNKT
jgi:hypothetical protein